MPRSRNVTGTAYALTVFAPIVPGQEAIVQAHIEALPTGADSPLARLEQLHTARLQIFDQPVFQGPGQKKRDRLESTYLVFTSSFDGDRDAYLEALCERLPDEADGWWGHCVGYPGTADRGAFKRYIDHNQIDTALFASAYPRASVSHVRDSLALRDRLVDFAADAQGLDAATLQERFLSTFSGADA